MQQEGWLKSVTKSYEDFSKKCGVWFQHPLANITFIFCIFIVLYAPVILSEKPIRYYSWNYVTNQKRNTILDEFAEEIKLILPRDKVLGTVLMTFARKIVTKSTTGPDVLTIAACNSCFTSLNNSLRPVFEKYLHYKVINVDVAENEKEAEFYQKMMTSLSNVEGKAVVFINGMDRMKEKTPLALQTISDENSAKYKNAILIFLILDDEISRQTGLNCDKNIFSHLLEHWKNPLLLEDQVYPIVSRVTKMTVCYSP